MSEHQNRLGQPIGFPVIGWSERAKPPRTEMTGRWCRLEPLDVDRHADELHAANCEDVEGRNWTYLPAEAFADVESYRAWLRRVSAADDRLFYALIDGSTRQAIGIAAYLGVDPAMGVIEIGHLNFSPRLQRTRAATEAMFVMMRCVFDELSYRRYEWKCDALNGPSRRAALRLGFTFEGIFRQARVVKDRNRDTAWFSIIDREWPALKLAYERWLNPGNFDAEGRQRKRLSEFMSKSG